MYGDIGEKKNQRPLSIQDEENLRHPWVRFDVSDSAEPRQRLWQILPSGVSDFLILYCYRCDSIYIWVQCYFNAPHKHVQSGREVSSTPFFFKLFKDIIFLLFLSRFTQISISSSVQNHSSYAILHLVTSSKKRHQGKQRSAYL